MFTKSCPLRVKAAGPADGLEEGQFLAYASVFGNVDSYGDVVVAGAFEETLTDWEGSDQNLPVLYGHDFYDPFSNIGWALEASEDDHGLLIKGQLDLENPKAKQVWRLMKGRRIGDMSFAYDVLDAGPSEEHEGATELRKLRLYEVSIVPIGANQETEILAVKSAAESLTNGIKAGRVISAKNEGELRKAYEAIGAVLAALDTTDDESKAMPIDPVKADELPDEALDVKADEPSHGAAELSMKTLQLKRRFLGL